MKKNRNPDDAALAPVEVEIRVRVWDSDWVDVSEAKLVRQTAASPDGVLHRDINDLAEGMLRDIGDMLDPIAQRVMWGADA